MATKQITARLEEPIIKIIRAYCKNKGIIMNSFIKECLLDKLEEIEDLEDLPKLRKEPSRPFSEVLVEIKKNG